MSLEDSDSRIAAVRAFNRFYTRKLGVLDQHLMKSPYSLSEARVLYELAHREEPSAKEIGTELGLDAGYLSRILKAFEVRGYILRETSGSDGRQSLLSMTSRGRKAHRARLTGLCKQTNEPKPLLLFSITVFSARMFERFRFGRPIL